MTRDRSDEQVLTAAAQIDQARAGGIPADELTALVAARAEWQATGTIRRSAELAAALERPAAADWDGVFTLAARKELSAPAPNVST